MLGDASKVLMDADGSGNLVYLPLDKLMERSGGSSGGAAMSARSFSSRTGGETRYTEGQRRCPVPEGPMMNVLKPGVVLILGALVVLVSMSLFTVDEREFAIKFRFGEIIAEDFEPGLHFKVPVVNNVRKFPNRILTINNPQELFLTEEKKNLYVDFFIKWRIIDVGAFLQSHRWRGAGGRSASAGRYQGRDSR